MNQAELNPGTATLIGGPIATMGVAGWIRTPMEKFRTMGSRGRPARKNLRSFRGRGKKFPFSLAVLASLLFVAGMASATTVITPGWQNPGRSPSNPFDYSNINITSNSPTATNSSIQDMFGASLSTLEAPGRTIFSDTPGVVSTSQVSFTTDAPVALAGFSLFLYEDTGSLNRSATNFELIANGNVISNVALAGVGQSYSMKFGSDWIEVSGSFSPIIATSFQAIFTNNNGNANGIRVMKFTGLGSTVSESLDPTPEPSSIQLVMLTGLVFAAFCRRRIKH